MHCCRSTLARRTSYFLIQLLTVLHTFPLQYHVASEEHNLVIDDDNHFGTRDTFLDILKDDRYSHAKEIAAQFSEKTDMKLVETVALEHGFVLKGRVGGLENVWYFEKLNNGRVKREAFDSFKSGTGALWAELQMPKIRVKRDLDAEPKLINAVKLPWPDPLYTKQWYLRQGAIGGFDMKVREAWRMGYSGKGVVVSILDDGVQGAHPDLAANYDPLASTDINSGDDDPTPRDNNDNKHGTRCAGEVAAVAGNAWCGVGIAYNAKIGVVRRRLGIVRYTRRCVKPGCAGADTLPKKTYTQSREMHSISALMITASGTPEEAVDGQCVRGRSSAATVCWRAKCRKTDPAP